MRILLITLLIAFLSACAAHNTNSTHEAYHNYYAKWRGMNANDLVKTWGTPNQTKVDRHGNKSYVYTTESTQSYPSSAAFGTTTTVNAGGLPVVTGAPPVHAKKTVVAGKCTTTFHLNKKNIVVGITMMGNSCPPSER